MNKVNNHHSEWIIFFGEDWGRHPSTSQFLAMELSKNSNILWINSLGLREPSLNISDARRALKKIWDFLKGRFAKRKHAAEVETSLPNNIFVVAPIALPWLRFGPVRRLNRFIVGSLIKKEMKNREISRPLLVSACPSSAVVIDALGADAKVYYCADEHSELPGMNKELVMKLEKQLLANVDLVVVTAQSLLESKSPLHKHVEYLPHGVDYHLLSQAVNKHALPADIRHLNANTPIVGFVGLLGEHIDMALIEYCAAELPDMNFVLIGPKEVSVTIPPADNIFYLGSKNRRDLVSYLAHFDVCINPYIQSERNRHANPTKIREYLAAGCPVVTTPQREASLIQGEVHTASSAHDFADRIRNLARQRQTLDRQSISGSMANDSWLERSNQLLMFINSARNRVSA